MKDVAKRYQDNLARIKKRVQDSHDYFKDNYDRYNEFRRFVFDSSLSEEEINMLMTMGRPQLEFNVLEAYISRLLGEFSKQEPDIEVSAYDENRADPMTINVVQQHLKHIFGDDDNHHLRYEVYKDLLSGGFSAVKVITDYEHSMSMDQVIKFQRCEPTLVGFDQLARLNHKGDSSFCFELFPKSKEQFEEEYPDIDIKSVSFTRDFAGFNWSYLNDRTEIIVVADYYEKKKKEEIIVQLRDGRVMTTKKYRQMMDTWNDITVPPSVVGKPRKTMIETINRYRLINNQILEHEETDFEMLPIVFIDGHSLMIKATKNGDIRQVTRPYVYHARGAQRLKNFAGNSLANQIENIVQHKFMVAKEALPKEEDFLQAYKDTQRESVLVFNSVHEEDPSMPIMNPIQQIANMPCPPEIAQAFTGADSLIQNVLGSFDASLGINNNQLSGVAIIEAATQSNAAAMPYIVGCLQGFQRLAQVYVNLMPKYFITPRTIPVLNQNGKREYVKINQEEGVDMQFDTNVLNVSLKAGASFQIQKARTINMVKDLMGMSPMFQEFVSTKGINFILSNMEGKGIEELKELTDQWQQEQQQKAAQEMELQQQQAQQNPAMVKAQVDLQKLDHEKQKDAMSFEIDLMKLQLEEQKVLVDAQLTKETVDLQMSKSIMENQRKKLDLKIKELDVGHRHSFNHRKLNHEISTSLKKGV